MSLKPPQEVSLRAEALSAATGRRSNLRGTIAINGGDCFVAEFILSPSTTLRTGLSKGSSQ
jgi:hypothetical protein